MFFLSEIEHTLRLPPYLLDGPLSKALKGELDGLFLDKVIGKLGLCISVYDIRSIDGGFIVAGDGAPTYTVKFRLVMFRPFVGEVISARLKESTKDGLRLSVGFFDDIYVPVPHLPSPNHFEPDPEHKDSGKWMWDYEEGTYPIHWADEIRFRVQSVSYPPIPLAEEKDPAGADSEPKDSKPFAPMLITASIESDGLGPTSWW